MTTIEWIPTTERLPEVEKHVLIATKDWVSIGERTSYGTWLGCQAMGTYEDTEFLKHEDVTHWAEKPKNPNK